MKYVQLLTHEIGTSCTLEKEHAGKCPISRKDRYDNVDTTSVLRNDSIISDVEMAYRMGFDGMLAWQYYCEPLLYMDRIEYLADEICKTVPQARHVLWTNGTLIGNGIDPKRLAIFSKIVISNYSHKNWDYLKEIVPDIKVLRGYLDGRLCEGRYTRKRCLRLFHELIIDAYGNWRLCCGDYMGTAVKMNVFTDGFPAIVSEYQRMRKLLLEEPQNGVPSICKRCSVHGRGVVNNLVEPSFTSISEMLLSEGISPDSRRA